MKVFKDLIMQKTTLVAIGALLLFQLVFGIVWLTSYSEVHQRTNLATIGVISERVEVKELLNLESQIDFNINYYEQLDSALADLQSNDIFLIIHFDDEFATNLATEQVSTLRYYINDANSLMVEGIVTPVMISVTAAVDKLNLLNSTANILGSLNMPQEQTEETLQVLASGIGSTVETLNPIETHAEKMIPLMVVLSSFVGSMVMAMFMNQSVISLRTKPCCKWKLYVSWLIVNLLSAIVIGLISGFIILLSNLSFNDFSFLNFWLFQSISLLSFMLITALFLILFNQLGMAINIFLLSTQLVTSGILVPQLFLTDFYQGLSNWLPATYMASGIYKILFTDMKVTGEITNLVISIALSLVAIFIVILIQSKLKEVKKNKVKSTVGI
ncbi:ABC transporter permease [Alkalihalophilus pseudofirmus]|uniref:ABC transporter permease n=1 Tax=Alkalihalophilus pseudofirmus TaxID=79885 RepID=UPI00259B0ACE|nr:ABC transporter permease [Alkalihalophilus pseudofirmus]WEG18277.1 ABC transporter permease [Alkalihalophilus pseudofirmus]